MNVYQVKKYLSNKINKTATIKYNLGRNKYDVFTAKLIKLYDNVFTVLVEKKYCNEIKCFSYNDIVMRLVKIAFVD